MTDHAARTTVEADVLEREVIDESLMRRLLQRAGRGLATPALDALELMLAPEPPSAARLRASTGHARAGAGTSS